MKENSGNTPLPRNWLERFLNASTDEDRRVLFEWELRELNPCVPPEEWWSEEVSWDLSAIGGPDDTHTEEFFWYYCLLVQAVQTVARALVDKKFPDQTDANRFNNLLDQARLRLAIQEEVVKGVLTMVPALPLFLLSSAAVSLWSLTAGETEAHLGRCKECEKFILDRSRGRKRETCSNKCRSAAYHKTNGYKQKQEKKKREAKKRKA
jgi:hypothetical protein